MCWYLQQARSAFIFGNEGVTSREYNGGVFTHVHKDEHRKEYWQQNIHYFIGLLNISNEILCVCNKWNDVKNLFTSFRQHKTVFLKKKKTIFDFYLQVVQLCDKITFH